MGRGLSAQGQTAMKILCLAPWGVGHAFLAQQLYGDMSVNSMTDEAHLVGRLEKRGLATRGERWGTVVVVPTEVGRARYPDVKPDDQLICKTINFPDFDEVENDDD